MLHFLIWNISFLSKRLVSWKSMFKTADEAKRLSLFFAESPFLQVTWPKIAEAWSRQVTWLRKGQEALAREENLPGQEERLEGAERRRPEKEVAVPWQEKVAGEEGREEEVEGEEKLQGSQQEVAVERQEEGKEEQEQGQKMFVWIVDYVERVVDCIRSSDVPDSLSGSGFGRILIWKKVRVRPDPNLKKKSGSGFVGPVHH